MLKWRYDVKIKIGRRIIREERREMGVRFLGLRKGRQWVRTHRSSKNVFIREVIGSLDFGVKGLNSMKCLVCDKNYRAIMYMKVFKSTRLQQTTPYTGMDRYPIIFSGCRDYFDGHKNIKILSYGCSTGEEVLTLRQYFPNATIVGAEINPNSLEICRSHSVDDNIKFITSKPSEIKKYGPFDLVFCMAVLQRTPHLVTEKGIKSLKKIYPFEKFEKQIAELDSYVKSEGLLVVHFSQYALTDTKVASNYEVFGSYNQDDYTSAIFDKNSEMITKTVTRYSVFKKIEKSH